MLAAGGSKFLTCPLKSGYFPETFPPHLIIMPPLKHDIDDDCAPTSLDSDVTTAPATSPELRAMGREPPPEKPARLGTEKQNVVGSTQADTDIPKKVRFSFACCHVATPNGLMPVCVSQFTKFDVICFLFRPQHQRSSTMRASTVTASRTSEIIAFRLVLSLITC